MYNHVLIVQVKYPVLCCDSI